jgi:hypothetical protein
MLTATVSGSFHRHMAAISNAVAGLLDLGVRVLSPADPRVVDNLGEFLFVASDRARSIKLVQDRHLESIRASDFLWLVAPDGYVGQSASMEIGYAVAAQIPVMSELKPADLTLRRYVQVVPTLRSAVDRLRVGPQSVHSNRDSFLIDPHASIGAAQRVLDHLREAFDARMHPLTDAAEPAIAHDRQELLRLVGADGAPFPRRG